MPENNRNELSDPALGELQGVYGTKKNVLGVIFLASVALLFLLWGTVSYLAAADIGSIFLCTLPIFLFAFIFLKMLRDKFIARKDELRIYRNGFTYRNRRETKTCRWDEIENFQTHRAGELMWVEKAGGEMIIFADDLAGTEKILFHKIDALSEKADRLAQEIETLLEDSADEEELFQAEEYPPAEDAARKLDTEYDEPPAAETEREEDQSVHDAGYSAPPPDESERY